MHTGARRLASELNMPFCVGVFVLENLLSNSVCMGVCLGGRVRKYSRLYVQKCLMSTILTLTGTTAAVCFKLLVCLARCTMWLRDGESTRGEQPEG